MGVIAMLYFATLRQAAVRCEACVSFEGRPACRTAQAGSQEEAQRMAIATACALVASGVTQTLACERQAAASLQCAPASGDGSGSRTDE